MLEDIVLIGTRLSLPPSHNPFAGFDVFKLQFTAGEFDMTFDESYARASGANTMLFNTLAAVVVAVVIVISMRLEMFTVGSPDQSFTIPRLVDATSPIVVSGAKVTFLDWVYFGKMKREACYPVLK